MTHKWVIILIYIFCTLALLRLKKKKTQPRAVCLTPIYYHHMRNLENTKIDLFICLKILKNEKKKEKRNEVILCITNFKIRTDYM